MTKKLFLLLRENLRIHPFMKNWMLLNLMSTQLMMFHHRYYEDLVKIEYLRSVAQQDLTFDHRVHQPAPYQLPPDDPPQMITFSTYYDALHQDDYLIQDELQDPICFQAQLDKDTIYYNQTMKVNYKKEFQIAMKKEFDAHSDRNHWEIIPKSEVPDDEKVLDSVWAMRRKRNILTNKVYKHKARLNIHGGQQEFAINYYETFSPIVNWFAIRILLIHALILK